MNNMAISKKQHITFWYFPMSVRSLIAFRIHRPHTFDSVSASKSETKAAEDGETKTSMTKSALVLTLIAVAYTPMTARAGLIYGVLNATGTANISTGSITFTGNTLNINSPASSQQGGFTVLEGTTGSIDNLTNPPDATGPLNIPDFITFAAAPNISITLTFLLPGINGAAGCSLSPAAAGQQCTPNTPHQSQYNLFNTSATSSTASFNVLGLEVDSTTGNTVEVTGAFTTPFTDLNYQQILATVLGGGTVTTSFAAEFATVAPEPGTLAEVMIGLVAVGISLSRRKKSRSLLD